MYRIHYVLSALLCLATALPAFAGQPVIELSNVEIDIHSRGAHHTMGAADQPIAHSAPAIAPIGSSWIVPYVVDRGNLTGTTTLVAVQVLVVDPEEAGGFLIRLYDEDYGQLNEQLIDIGHREIYTFNLRDQPGLGASGLRRGLVKILPSDGVKVSVDYFIVTPGEDFAVGGLAFSELHDPCTTYTSRVLLGGPFTGGTRFLVYVDTPLGVATGSPPTLVGNVFDEAGAFVNSFQVNTDIEVFELDAADLIGPAQLFGYIDFAIQSPDAGTILSFTSAEGRYSVGTPSVCTEI